MSGRRDTEFAALVADLARCQENAAGLGLDLLPDLIGAAVIEAALQWDGGAAALRGPDRLDALMRLKLRVAAARSGGTVVHLRPAP